MTRLSPVQLGVVAAVVLTGSTAALVFESWSFYTGTHTDVLSTVSSFLAAGCCWWTARGADGASRWCWMMFGAAVTLWTAAEVAWFANGLGVNVSGMIPAANALCLVGLGPIVAADAPDEPGAYPDRSSGVGSDLVSVRASGAAPHTEPARMKPTAHQLASRSMNR
jgi:hypothetical protein